MGPSFRLDLASSLSRQRTRTTTLKLDAMYKSLNQCTCGRAIRSSSVAPNSRRHFAESTSSATKTTPRRIVASIWPAQPVFGTHSTRSRTFTSSTQVRAAVVDDNNPLPFPKKANPSPFEIFHLPRDKRLSPKEVKGVSGGFFLRD